MTIKLDADSAASAYKAWAQSQISGLSTERLEASKFFFAASTGTLGFFVALWKALENKHLKWDDLETISILLLAASTIWSMLMFWPISHYFSYDTNIQDVHRKTVRRLKIEAFVWALFWTLGTALSLIVTFHAEYALTTQMVHPSFSTLHNAAEVAVPVADSTVVDGSAKAVDRTEDARLG